ncbi:fumarylacetoacetate hydrolase family protein [Streptomyces sp. Root369]|uniref:fumarylacetoacetate hydrolase family protein n=1 Tax=Streptomyces sp. Root369 TaxID=1736523 RepID=UPI000709EFB3|nr:fumarylacetoacetate hydrolase family protein [Streptomyces sp. Root369]KQV93494.1 hypothetical protein ASD08_15735 [Streptomyces sp. Root369]
MTCASDETPESPVLASVVLSDGITTAAAVHAGRFLRLDRLVEGTPATLTDLVRRWEEFGDTVERALLGAAPRIAEDGAVLREVAVTAPVVGGQTYCAIGNYRGQLAQAAADVAAGAGEGSAGDADGRRLRADLERGWRERRATGAPYVALTGSVRIAGPFDPLELSADLTTLDWEVELAAVIGSCGAGLSPHAALDVVAGYCVANDLTLRGAVFRTDVPALGGDWLTSKGRPGWLPLGPWLVPASSVPDPDALGLALRLNGQQMQADRTSDMLFSVAEVIAHVSQHTELRPGDVVCTGSPAGFGAHYGRYLRAGDVVEAGVERLGTQRFTVVSESAAVGAGHGHS